MEYLNSKDEDIVNTYEIDDEIYYQLWRMCYTQEEAKDYIFKRRRS